VFAIQTLQIKLAVYAAIAAVAALFHWYSVSSSYDKGYTKGYDFAAAECIEHAKTAKANAQAEFGRQAKALSDLINSQKLAAEKRAAEAELAKTALEVALHKAESDAIIREKNVTVKAKTGRLTKPVCWTTDVVKALSR
jgi:ATPase subunit of ABC transporter with duplicated ATPase domains